MTRKDAAILAMSKNDIQRFWSMVNTRPGQGPSGDCQGWEGYINDSGYGEIKLNGSQCSAHRVAFFLHNGCLPPSDKPNACHECDWPPCCRGDHLFAGTQQDNIEDRTRKGRSSRGSGRHTAVLTEVTAVEMRELHRVTGMSFAGLGVRFGVDRTTARRCVLRQTWKHV